jgi:hypothetical protein
MDNDDDVRLVTVFDDGSEGMTKADDVLIPDSTASTLRLEIFMVVVVVLRLA